MVLTHNTNDKGNDMTTKNPQIARTIQQQLGGALVMLGAHTLVDHGNGLSFKFRGSRAANYMRILLDAGTDTYSVQFQKVGSRRNGWKSTIVSATEFVHVEALHGLIESTTGLFTRM